MTENGYPEAVSLFEFTQRVGNTIHTRPELRNVWITAELSDVAVRGGHFYTDLIQKNDAGQTVARMRANLWASLYQRLRSKYFSQRQEDLRNGIKVKIQGSATHHNLYGLSFNITDIDPSYVDEGDILRRRMEILDKMKKEGIFDDNRAVSLPMDCQRIAVISANGAAGLGDFMNQLQSSQERFRFEVRLFESPMQGERAAAGVINALGEIAVDSELWDCVVIIRGGGATSDMNCFDDERLARNVCMFPIPVIVGIGHERDNCVLDYLANTRCKTPTAVAEFLISHQRKAWQTAAEKVNEIIRYATLFLDGEKQKIAQLEASIPALAMQIVDKEKLRLRNFSSAIPLAVSGFTAREATRLDGMRNQLLPLAVSAISRAAERLKAAESLLHVLSPENTLKRGYSITRLNGKAVRDPLLIMPGSIIETELASGRVKSQTI